MALFEFLSCWIGCFCDERRLSDCGPLPAAANSGICGSRRGSRALLQPTAAPRRERPPLPARALRTVRMLRAGAAGGVGKSAAPGGAVVVGHGAIPPQRVPSVGAHSPDAPLSSSGGVPTGLPVRLSRFGGRREPTRRPAAAGRCLDRIVRVLRSLEGGNPNEADATETVAPRRGFRASPPRVHPPAGLGPAGRTGSRATGRVGGGGWGPGRSGSAPAPSRPRPACSSAESGSRPAPRCRAPTGRRRRSRSPGAVGTASAGDRRPAVARIEEGVRIGRVPHPVSGLTPRVPPSDRV